MALDINYFLKINNTYGTTSNKDVQLYNLKNQVNDRFMDTIDYYKVKINDIDRDTLIIKTTNQDEKAIKSRAGESFELGDYVAFDGNTWMIISKDMCNQVYTSGKMKLTNYTLKFQSVDGTILSYPCIDETNSSVGIDANNTISVPNSIHTIKLPFDLHTSALGIDRRLYISRNMDKPRSFKITKINDTEFNYGEKGLIEFTLEETPNQENNDRPDLGICNYFEPNVAPTPSPTGYTMSISASGQLIIGGSQRRFTPKLVDSNGIEQSFVGTWSFQYVGMLNDDFAITYEGNDCLIKVVENYDIIDLKLTLTCTSSDGLYSASYVSTIMA